MVDDVDLYRSAWVLMKQHGTVRALEICEERYVEMAKQDDLLGACAWRGIKSAIEELERKPKPGEPMN